MPETAEIVIAGGGVIGSSIAYHLARAGAGRIVVVEKDFSYARAASALSAGSIRQQFSSPINIRISQYGISFLRDIGHHLTVEEESPDIGLHEGGYLYLASEAGAAILAENHAVQRVEGADVALLDTAALRARFPWIATDDLACGSLGLSAEGWFDGYGLMRAFRSKAIALGVTYREDKVIDVLRTGGTVTGIRLEGGEALACGAFVVAAGASGARALCAAAGVPIPVHAKKRCVFPFTCAVPVAPVPLVIDTSGVWWRPEGDGFIAGYSPDDGDEADHGSDFDVDWNLWEDILWPALAARCPAFEAIRVGRAWAGHYDMMQSDHNAIVGRLGSLENSYVAAGFSGHGLQQSPAVGRGLAELITTGAYQTLDLSPLGFERIAEGRLLVERNVI